MVILEVRLNGELVARVGGEDLTRSSVLAQIHGQLGPKSEATFAPKARLEMLGKAGASDQSGEVRRWTPRPLILGDVLEVRLVDSSVADEPSDRQSLSAGPAPGA